MEATIEVPKAFSVRDDHEFLAFKHLMARLNPGLRVRQVGMGLHVHSGNTVFWGLVSLEGQRGDPARNSTKSCGKRASTSSIRPEVDYEAVA